MTETVSHRLHEEAHLLETPEVDAPAVIRQGRSMRRRRHGVQALAALAVAGVIAGSYAVVRPGGGTEAAPTPQVLTSGDVAGPTEWAFAAGSTVHLAQGGTVTVPGAVKSLYYTSSGLLVRTGRTSSTDENRSNYWLVGRDGKVTDFRLSLGDRVPSTDPSEPYVAYADAAGDDSHWNVVLRDVATGEVAHTIPVEGRFTWGGWVAPPVSLSGDHVYVGLDDATLDVAWRTGEVSVARALPRSTMPTAHGDREVISHWAPPEPDDPSSGLHGSARVVDTGTGDVVLRLDYRDSLPYLSPDGSTVMLRPTMTCDQDDHCTFDKDSAQVYVLPSGAEHTLRLTGKGIGWTADGGVLQVGTDSVTVCHGEDCASTPVKVGEGPIRVAGALYES
jgi:hypothetical protein